MQRLWVALGEGHDVPVGFVRATLTTFEQVPRNAPLHARRGFHALREGELSGGLVRSLARENALGLSRRVAMARALRSVASANPVGPTAGLLARGVSAGGPSG